MLLASSIGLSLIGVLLFLRVTPKPHGARKAPVRCAPVPAVRDFWCLAIPFFVCGVTSTGITDTHLVAYMEGCGTSAAARRRSLAARSRCST